MAKANPKTVGTDEPAVPVIETEFVPIDAEFDAAVAELDPASGGRVSVYREGPGGYRDLKFIKSFLIGEFQKEMLQRPPFNGGRFRLHLQDANKQFMRNVAFECEPDKDAIEAAQLDAERKRRELEREARAPAQGSADTAVLLQGMLAGFKGIAEAMTVQKAQGMDVEQTIRLFSVLQGAQPARREVDPLDMISRIVAIQRDLAPPVGADGDVGTGALLLRAIDTFGKPLMEAVGNAKQAQAAQPAPNPAPVSLPAPLPAYPAQSVHAVPEPEETELNLKMRFIKPVILLAASNQADPYTYANMMLDNFTPEEVDKYINAPDWFDQLCTLVPELRAHREWCQGVKAAIGELLTPEAEAGKTSGDSQSQSPDDAG